MEVISDLDSTEWKGGFHQIGARKVLAKAGRMTSSRQDQARHTNLGP